MVPEEVPEEEPSEDEKSEAPETPKADIDEDEAVIEDVTEEAEEKEKKRKEPELVQVTREEWGQMNSQPPLWMR